MHTMGKIQQHLQQLPDSLQEEVLHFIEYLLFNTEHEATRQEASSWFSLSLTHAMRGMEDEDTPPYTLEDVQERFS
jgi:hypothetical protein